MPRPGDQFKLECLEPRVLLSADPSAEMLMEISAMPDVLQYQLVDEVQDHSLTTADSSFINQHSSLIYAPADQTEDLFANLPEPELLSTDVLEDDLVVEELGEEDECGRITAESGELLSRSCRVPPSRVGGCGDGWLGIKNVLTNYPTTQFPNCEAKFDNSADSTDQTADSHPSSPILQSITSQLVETLKAAKPPPQSAPKSCMIGTANPWRRCGPSFFRPVLPRKPRTFRSPNCP